MKRNEREVAEFLTQTEWEEFDNEMSVSLLIGLGIVVPALCWLIQRFGHLARSGNQWVAMSSVIAFTLIFLSAMFCTNRLARRFLKRRSPQRTN
jgi:hypothetical protein